MDTCIFYMVNGYVWTWKFDKCECWKLDDVYLTIWIWWIVVRCGKGKCVCKVVIYEMCYIMKWIYNNMMCWYDVYVKLWYMKCVCQVMDFLSFTWCLCIHSQSDLTMGEKSVTYFWCPILYDVEAFVSNIHISKNRYHMHMELS
jgi:hypothetical protein